MKRVLFFGLLVFIWTALISSMSFAADHKMIDGKGLEAMMSDGRPIVIVDVREPYEFAAGHIKGAINIPYYVSKPRILKELSPDNRIVFVCHGGPMGDELSDVLVKNGYKDVSNLKGGMRKWKGEIVK